MRSKAYILPSLKRKRGFTHTVQTTTLFCHLIKSTVQTTIVIIRWLNKTFSGQRLNPL
jgi:hypothetical protein